MHPLRLSAAGLLAVTALACGGDSRPTAPAAVPSPTPPPSGLAPGATVTIVSALDDAPVAGASVTIGGRAYVADGAGRVVTDERAILGTLIDVTSPAFFDRQSSLRFGPPLTRLSLWPRATPTGVDENYTISIVYTSAGIAGPGPAGAEPLRRLPPDTQSAVVVPTAELLDDPAAHESLIRATSGIAEVTRGVIRYALARDRPPAGVVFEARVDPTESLCVQRARAFVRWTLRGNIEITGGTIVFCSLADARTSTAVHEMGHTLGLLHSPDARDVMFPNVLVRGGHAFGPRESETIKLMLDRRAGNRYPDSDRQVTGASVTESVIVCD